MSREVQVMIEIFIASVVYWLSIVVLYIWLNRRLVELKARIGYLETRMEEKEKNRKNET